MKDTRGEMGKSVLHKRDQHVQGPGGRQVWVCGMSRECTGHRQGAVWGLERLAFFSGGDLATWEGFEQRTSVICQLPQHRAVEMGLPRPTRTRTGSAPGGKGKESAAVTSQPPSASPRSSFDLYPGGRAGCLDSWVCCPVVRPPPFTHSP